MSVRSRSTAVRFIRLKKDPFSLIFSSEMIFSSIYRVTGFLDHPLLDFAILFFVMYLC